MSRTTTTEMNGGQTFSGGQNFTGGRNSNNGNTYNNQGAYYDYRSPEEWHEHGDKNTYYTSNKNRHYDNSTTYNGDYHAPATHYHGPVNKVGSAQNVVSGGFVNMGNMGDYNNGAPPQPSRGKPRQRAAPPAAGYDDYRPPQRRSTVPAPHGQSIPGQYSQQYREDDPPQGYPQHSSRRMRPKVPPSRPPQAPPSQSWRPMPEVPEDSDTPDQDEWDDVEDEVWERGDPKYRMDQVWKHRGPPEPMGAPGRQRQQRPPSNSSYGGHEEHSTELEDWLSSLSLDNPTKNQKRGGGRSSRK
ncbi:hypothetical protein MD484_g5471, partial [Candolleomyces efflorescens]